MTNSVSNILSLQNLQVGYNRVLLKDLSINLQSSGLVGIIGNNGKGKTTLLKNISGLLKPLSGTVLFNEKNILQLSAEERARIVSLNLTSNQITFPIRVNELVSMGRYPYTNHWAGLTKLDEDIVAQCIAICEIDHLKNKFVTDISDGERQKVFIAKTLAQQTPVILFDEPTAFLDYSSKKQFFQTMKKIAVEQNKIIIISSHDIDFLTAYADDLIMIENDETVLFGKTLEIINSAYFEGHFTKK